MLEFTIHWFHALLIAVVYGMVCAWIGRTCITEIEDGLMIKPKGDGNEDHD